MYVMYPPSLILQLCLLASDGYYQMYLSLLNCVLFLIRLILLVMFTSEVSPSRLLSLPSRFRPQGYYHYLHVASRFRPRGCYIYLRGFALKVIIIYLWGFAFKIVIFTFEVSPSRLLSFFTFEVSPSRLLYFPLGFCPQGCYNYLPLRFRPQGCFIFAFEVSPSVIIFIFEASPSVSFWAFIGLAGVSMFCLTWLVPALCLITFYLSL